jgi:streptomycin 6-kinase
MATLTLHAQLKAAADSFRLGREAEGNTAFARIVERLQAELGAAGPSALAPLLPTFESIFAAQQRSDWLFVADLLEHQLAKMLIES